MNRRDQFFIMTAAGLAALAPCIWLSGANVDYPDRNNLISALESQAADAIALKDIFPGAWNSLTVACNEDGNQTLKFTTASESQNLNTPKFKLGQEILNLCLEGSKTFKSTDSVTLNN